MCSWSAQQHTSTRGVRGLHTSLRSTITSSDLYSGSRNVQPPPSCAVSTRRTVSETRRDRGGCGGKGSVGGVGGAGSVGVGVDCGGSNGVGGAAAAEEEAEEEEAEEEEAAAEEAASRARWWTAWRKVSLLRLKASGQG